MLEESELAMKALEETAEHIVGAVEAVSAKFSELAFDEAMKAETEQSDKEEKTVIAALKEAGCLHKNSQGDMLASFIGCRPFFTAFLKTIGIVLETTGICKGINGWSIVAHGDNGAVIVSRIVREGNPDAIPQCGTLMVRK